MERLFRLGSLATKHGIHPTMVGEWKRQAMEGMTAVFADRSVAKEVAKSSEAEIEKLLGPMLYNQHNQLSGSGAD